MLETHSLGEAQEPRGGRRLTPAHLGDSDRLWFVVSFSEVRLFWFCRQLLDYWKLILLYRPIKNVTLSY